MYPTNIYFIEIWKKIKFVSFKENASRKYRLQNVGHRRTTAVVASPVYCQCHIPRYRLIWLQIASNGLPSLAKYCRWPTKEIATHRKYKHSIKPKCRHIDEIFVTGCTVNCQLPVQEVIKISSIWYFRFDVSYYIYRCDCHETGNNRFCLPKYCIIKLYHEHSTSHASKVTTEIHSFHLTLRWVLNEHLYKHLLSNTWTL